MSTDYTVYNPSLNGSYTVKFSNFFTQLTSDVSNIENNITTNAEGIAVNSNLILAIQTGDYMSGTSTTSSLIETGSKTFTVAENNRGWAIGTSLKITDANSTLNYMAGDVSAYSGNSVTVEVTTIAGSGTKADWSLSINPIGGPYLTEADRLSSVKLHFLTQG